MNLFAGLEKFGIKADENASLFEEEKKANASANGGAQKEEIPSEESFLLDKNMQCPVCYKAFKTKIVKNRVRRLEPDVDLRPRFEYIDTIKYNVVSCPHCGYTALNRYFEHVSSIQRKLINEQISSKFSPTGSAEAAVVDYDTAIERYKLALFNAIVKKGKNSEKAYICLNIAWLYRGKAEQMEAEDADESKKAECKEQEEAFYQQAFEGFMKAISTESFPMCGMDSTTVDYLLAAMSYHYKKYDVTSKCLARIQGSPSASKTIKDRALDLKEKIRADLKNNRAQ